MKTRNNIYHNLEFTEFVYQFDSEISFYFSSAMHLRKFTDLLKDYQFDLKQSLEKRFKIEMEIGLFAALQLYKKIETRGFYIKIGGNKLKWENNLKFVGQIKTK